MGKSSNHRWISWFIDVFHEWLIYWCHGFLTRPFCTTPWPFPPLAADSPTSQRPDRWRPRFVSCWRCGDCFRLRWMQHDATIQVDSGLINHLIIIYIYSFAAFSTDFPGFSHVFTISRQTSWNQLGYGQTSFQDCWLRSAHSWNPYSRRRNQTTSPLLWLETKHLCVASIKFNP